MNKFILTGNLGNDHEMKHLPNGDALCEFSVGVKSGFGDKEKTLWVKCSMFGKRAAGQLPQYLVKGTKVCISGELSMDEWEKDGVKNKMLKLRVEDLDLIGAKQDGQQQAQPMQHQPPQQQYAPQQQQQPQGGFAPQGQPQHPQNMARVDQGQPQQGGFPQQPNFNQGQR
jgi:single-strand DNA-binding protein